MEGTVPVAIFGFNRPDMLKSAIHSLDFSLISRLYIIIDGPRDGNTSDKHAYDEIGQMLASARLPEDTTVLRRSENLGLRLSFESGLDFVFEREKFCMVLEDDVRVSRDFFTLAAFYSKLGRPAGVASLSAHNPNPRKSNQPVTTKFHRIWGWATWADVWQEYRGELSKPPEHSTVARLHSLTQRIMFSRMLHNATLRLGTWDIDFVAHLICKGYLSITPPVNTCANLGLASAQATNAHDFSMLEVPPIGLWERPVFPSRLPPPSRLDSLREDFIRLSRWLKLALRHPLSALKKLLCN